MNAIKQTGINKGYLFDGKMEVYPSLPLSDYPRPQLVRDSFVSLHGFWELKITKDKELPSSFDRLIQVPFPLEAKDSGISYLASPDDYIFYHKVVTLPDDFVQNEIILHFEGIDQSATIYIDRKKVLKHQGMYDSFSVILDKNTPKMFDLIVRVHDISDQGYYGRGKQSLNPKFFTYTTTTGIYKPVWMESVKENYIQSIQYEPDFKKTNIKINIQTKETTTIRFIIQNQVFSLPSNHWTTISIGEFHLWSIDDPYLYPCKAEIDGLDTVTSYLAIRKIEMRELSDHHKYMFLNDHPLFLSGLLDQGYYGYNNLTPAHVEEYKKDILGAKAMGFNCLRVHVTTLCDTFYYYADLLGVYIIQDIPNGGRKVPFLNVALPKLFSSLNDENKTNYKKLGRVEEENRDMYYDDMISIQKKLACHPCVLIYTLFNEGWGQFDASLMYNEFKKIVKDNNLIDTTSGWYEAKESDFYSVHTYNYPLLKRKNKYHHCYIISECGGIAYKPENSPYKKQMGYSKANSKEKLFKKIKNLYVKKLLPQISERGLCGIIYTQLADVETEYNGLYNFNKEECKVDSAQMKEMNQIIYSAFDEYMNSLNK